jgi:PPK2 family polyphosphate:nucleotide phosphotransferase
MAKGQVLRPKPGERISLADFDADYTGNWNKVSADKAEDELEERLEALQEVLYAQGKHALLVVLQAMDAGGKDGTIKKVFKGVNPLGFKIANFKAPTPLELSHDFLWRVHQQVPPKGYIGIFNRSHYEDVLIVRVNQLAPEAVWRARYEYINNFEKLLADSGVTILKFYLHISKDEQKERFQARLDNPEKNWKFSIGDLPVREKWDEYMRAYEDAISFCNTEYAPWHIVPANKKWYRDYIITKTIVDTLEALNMKYPEPEPGLDKVVIPG